MCNNAVCIWVANMPVAKARGTHNINVVSADHSQTFIHRERYYVIQTQLKMASDHSLCTQIFRGSMSPDLSKVG